MRRRTMLAAFALFSLVVAACGEPPADTAATPAPGDVSEEQHAGSEDSTQGARASGSEPAGGDQAGASDFHACMLTDVSGIDDPFASSAWQGLQTAAQEHGYEVQYSTPQVQNQYAPNIDAFIDQGCGIIVTLGFLMADATEAAATANPDTNFAIVDYTYDDALDNVRGLVFDIAQASFLAGYVSAAVTKTGVVSVFGGVKIPPVQTYMDGYAEGVRYYNEQHDTDVTVLGWDVESQEGTFVGNFDDQVAGRRIATSFIDQGADIVFPIAGDVGGGSAQALLDHGGDVKLIWADTDGCETVPQYCEVILTSTLKQSFIATEQAVVDAANGAFTGGTYVGDLENGAVDIAPFHEFESLISDELQAELDDVRQGIISGDIEITSPTAPSSG